MFARVSAAFSGTPVGGLPRPTEAGVVSHVSSLLPSPSEAENSHGVYFKGRKEVTLRASATYTTRTDTFQSF